MYAVTKDVQYFIPQSDIMHKNVPTVQWAPAVEIFQLQDLTHLHANANGGNYPKLKARDEKKLEQ